MILFSAEAILASSASKFGIEVNINHMLGQDLVRTQLGPRSKLIRPEEKISLVT